MMKAPRRDLFPVGAVIPAHPLALDATGRVDWRAQRALTRYYVAAGAHGLAVGVHTTQFPLHQDAALLSDVLRAAAEESSSTAVTRVAGVAGLTASAVAEAERARELGYDAVLLSLHGCDDDDEDALIDRARAVGEVMPTIAFYIQESAGGRYLSREYWRRVFDLPSTVAVKAAPFDRYRTADVAYTILETDRWRDIVMLTGNDDAIVSDLTSEYRVVVGGETRSLRVRGGLLGQWAVGTAHAVSLSGRLAAADCVSRDDVALGSSLTDVNAAVFDVENGFHGSVAGVNETLRQQGLLQSSQCLAGAGALSPRQSEKIALARSRYPLLLDEDFVAANREAWLGS